MKKTTFLIVGKHAVVEALKNPRRKIERVFVTEDAKKTLNRENQHLNLLKNCINKSKIVAITTIDVDIYEKKIKYSVLNNYLDNEKNYEDTKYEKYNDSKEKILTDLRYKKREIKQLDKDLLKDLNFYVTAREYPTIKINNLSFDYGFEGYVLIENKRNINSDVTNDIIL